MLWLDVFNSGETLELKRRLMGTRIVLVKLYVVVQDVVLPNPDDYSIAVDRHWTGSTETALTYSPQWR